MEDASLDEFLDGASESNRETESEAARESTAAPEGNESSAHAEDSTPDAPERQTANGAPPTMVYTPAGATCAACGAVVERRWETADGLCCVDCKAW